MASNHPVLKVARPTDDIEALIAFYGEGAGFSVLSRFSKNGFDGLILGHEKAPWHLEFTTAHGHTAGGAPTQDNLLVFYLPDAEDFLKATARMQAAGFDPVPSFNPWWDDGGVTFQDPNGYRIVFYNDAWPR